MNEPWVKSRRAASEDDYETWIWGGVSPTLNAFDNATETRATVVVTVMGDRTHTLTHEGHDASEDGTGRGTPVIAFYSSGGGNDAPAQDISPTVKVGGNLGIPSPPAVAYGFSAKDSGADATPGLAPTLRAMPHDNSHANGGGQMAVGLHDGMRVRRLTPRECERLQGFPDDWTLVTDKTADSHRYKQMGNAVTVNVAAYIGRLIMDKVAADAS